MLRIGGNAEPQEAPDDAPTHACRSLPLLCKSSSATSGRVDDCSRRKGEVSGAAGRTNPVRAR